MSDCLHCDINDLVEEQLEIEGTELVDVAAKIAESLADLILLAPATRAGLARTRPDPFVVKPCGQSSSAQAKKISLE
jgi:hypothetical protein